MSIEAGIGEKTKNAIDANKDHPDFSIVFDDWKNNTSKAENQAELKLINDAARGLLPYLTITDFTTDKAGARFVVTFDEKTKTSQLRTVENFTPVDPRLLESDTKKGEDEKSNYQQPTNTETKPANVEVYAITPGDSLWKIARHKLEEVNNANGKSGTKPSTIEVKAFIDKIVAANQEGDGAIKDPNLIYSGKSLNIPIEKKAETETKADSTSEAPKGPENKAPDGSTETTKDPENKAPDSSIAPSKDGDNKNNSNSESQSKSNVALKFTADPGTYENPTIGSEEATAEAAALKKYFAPMQKLFDYRSGADELTQEEITEFVTKCRNDTVNLNDENRPSPDELAALENAAKHIDRIANVGFDLALGQVKGASSKDIEGFARQESDFEGRYQARFYLEKHFDRIAPGKSEVTVAEIKEYRSRLASDPQSTVELKAVDNLLAQLAKSKVEDSLVLKKADAKAAISDKVDGSTYEVYGGASYPAPQVPAS